MAAIIIATGIAAFLALAARFPKHVRHATGTAHSR